MKFWKMNGAGNDFIVINNIEEKIPAEKYGEIARLLCERHMSIGADGMMFVEPSEKADYKMAFYNSDGSMGEMCGNGARCICRYGYEVGLAGEVQTVETTAGIVTGHRIDNRLYKIRLNDPSTIQLDHPMEIDGKTYDCSYVELGNPGIPHIAVAVEGLKDYPTRELFDLGRKMRYHESLPKGANINFYEITGEDQVYERTYERGVEDFTYACGTGTGSMVTVLTLKGKVSGSGVRVGMTGGELIIDVERGEDGKTIENLYLTGPTNIVAKGEVTDEDLCI
ncbi:MAG: diaminopimelate epimerase [Firmicutes bacterium]|nr:diaminopimelate epimerase [Bacillota bacterium]MBR3707329.1 diaminopimelate epimerase [Bacillota bacterium]